MPGRVRVALVGYGLGGSVFHAPLIDATAALSLDAIVTSNPGRRAEAISRYPSARVVTSVDELLRHPADWDLVVVTVPNANHYAVAERVVRAGLPTVIDKPITPTAVEAERLLTLATEHGVSVIPYHNRRWDGDFLTVTELLAGRRLGDVWRFESRFERWRPGPPPSGSWKQDPALPGGGILFDLGSHLVDQALALFGRPSSLYAERSQRDTPVDDDAFIALTYAGGLVVHLWASSKTAQLGPRFRILGSKRAFVKYGLDPQEDALRAGRLPSEPDWGQEPAKNWGWLGTVEETEAIPTKPGRYQDFYQGVARHLLEGAPPPVDVRDAIDGLKIMEAAVTSARTRTVVPYDHG